MKNGRIHLIYLATIGFLAFQYWTKTEALYHATESIEQFNKLLERNNQTADKTAMNVSNDIDKEFKGYPSSMNQRFLALSKNTKSLANSMQEWLSMQKIELAKVAGGFDKADTTVLVNHLSTDPSKVFFTNQKIKEMRDHLMDFHNTLIVHDSILHKEMQGKYAIFKLLNNDVYWQKLKMKTVSDAFAQLTALQNQVYLDEILYLNYIFNQVSGTTLICGPTFKVAIAPNKAALIENEVLKADIYLAQYSTNPGSDIVFIVNNKELPVRDGVAHFETKERTVGTKKIKAEARIRNPLTGQTTNHFGEFEYEVLPKCSRDCK